MSERVEVIEVREERGSWTSTRRTADLSAEVRDTPSRSVPEWATIERIRRKDGDDVTVVRWGERERRFEGPDAKVWPVRAIFPTPEPGVLLVVREGLLLRIDMASGEERELLSGVEGWLDPSPDGSAVLVRTRASSVVFDTRSCMELTSRIERADLSAQWVDSADASRVLWLLSRGVRDPATRVLDLDTGVKLELERDPEHPLLLRVGERGYLYVQHDGDLVLTSLDGSCERVLVER